MRWVDSPAVGATRAPALAATVRANMLAASVDVCALESGLSRKKHTPKISIKH